MPEFSPEQVERVAEVLWVESERWRQRNRAITDLTDGFPYERLIEPTKADLREYARAVLGALEADREDLHLAGQALAKIVREEYPGGYSLAEIASIWNPGGISTHHLAALERAAEVLEDA
jgi:hypothetical protein